MTGSVSHVIASFVAEVTCFATSVQQSVQSHSRNKWVLFSVQHVAGGLPAVVVLLSTKAILRPWVLYQPCHQLHQPAPHHRVSLIALIVNVVSSRQLVSDVITAIVVCVHQTDQPFPSLVLLALASFVVLRI